MCVGQALPAPKETAGQSASFLLCASTDSFIDENLGHSAIQFHVLVNQGLLWQWQAKDLRRAKSMTG
jgi:hypothetical protein